jgi:hypothetical protein
MPLLRLVPALVLAASLATAADDAASSFDDLRITLRMLPGYQVKESADRVLTDADADPATPPTWVDTETTYEWEGEDALGGAVAIEWLHGTAGGFLGGLGLSIGTDSITPSGFSVNGQPRNNDGLVSMTWRQYGLIGSMGWHSGPVQFDGLVLTSEITAYLEGGVMYAKIDDLSGSASGTGFYGDAGLRAGVYLGERTWYFGGGLTASTGVATASVSAPSDTDGGSLEMSRTGLGLFAAAGRRF